ncbi:hypothetical protein [Neobacillus soli]|uniref:hypothetical protein n=1 Tax=Neobacillus soli TaxID=220688 RepID=UPI000826082D|nr:hypothetical protein [Neobacillus soli]
MYLAFKDLASLFADRQGIEDDMVYYTVTDQANVVQPKGLFIRLTEESGELSEAIANGAIAAIWDQENRVPQYTPNHFPIFFTNDPAVAIRNLLNLYNEKIDGETDEKMEITNFKFTQKKLLNKNKETYDIAVMLKKVTNKSDIANERRG